MVFMLHCQITGNIPSQCTKTNSLKDVCPSLAYSSDFRRRASVKATAKIARFYSSQVSEQHMHKLMLLILPVCLYHY